MHYGRSRATSRAGLPSDKGGMYREWTAVHRSYLPSRRVVARSPLHPRNSVEETTGNGSLASHDHDSIIVSINTPLVNASFTIVP